MFKRLIGAPRRALRTAAMPALLAIGLVAAVPSWGQSNDGPMGHAGTEEHMKAMQAHHAEMLKRHLDASAERLELKSSQMPAWQAFAAAFTALHERPPGGAMGPMGMDGQADKLDAAAMAKMIADHAADHARKLATLADATAKLQATMSDSQKALFTQMARHHVARMFHHQMHHGMGMEGMEGMHGMGMHGQHDRDGEHGMGMHDRSEADGDGAPMVMEE